MRLTKSDFTQYLHCRNALWLRKHRPEDYPVVEHTPHDVMLSEQGYAFETIANAHLEGQGVAYQQEFEADGLYARADVTISNPDGSIDILEVKSASSAKDEHKLDAAFQTMVARRAGLEVRRVAIVHVSKGYQRHGEIDPGQLIAQTDVTQEVENLIPTVEANAAAAQAYLALEAIDERSCTCLYLKKDDHCVTFGHFNRNVPEQSIYDLPSFRKSIRETCVDEGRLAITALRPEEIKGQWERAALAVLEGGVWRDDAFINDWLNKLVYPIYFLDFEGFGPPLPPYEGAIANIQDPFQYSLHMRVSPSETAIHKAEYLTPGFEPPRALAEQLLGDIGPDGSIIAWYHSYERQRLEGLAERFPDLAEPLLALRERTVDLRDIFVKGYVNAAFKGSTSIKDVLPVMAPEMVEAYESLPIGNGNDAMAGWVRYNSLDDGPEKQALRDELLAYCKLDTYATVRLLRAVETLVAS